MKADLFAVFELSNLAKVFFTCLLFPIACSSVHSQDYWIPLETPTERDFNKMCWLDTLKGWVVGDSGTILKTTDGGLSWTFQESGIRNDILDIFMLDENQGWGIALDLPSRDNPVYGTLFLKTENGGATWENQPIPEKFFRAVKFLDPLRGWMGGEYGILEGTTDGGLTWFPANVDSSTYSGFGIRNIKFHTPNYGYAMGGQFDIVGVVWRTTDGGQRWVIQAVNSEPLNGFFFFDSMNIIAVGGDFDFGAGIVRTSTGGEKWDYLYPAVWGEAREVAFRTPAEGWAPLGFAGTYMFSLDSGRTWTDRFTPDSSAVYDIAFLDSRTGYMVGDRGTVLKFNPSAVGVREESVEIPSSTALHQNYPNPFNPSTSIKYTLVERSLVTIEVFDLLGREVQTLLKGAQESGLHEVGFDAEGLPSGMYFYRLTAQPQGNNSGRYSETRKMLLVR